MATKYQKNMAEYKRRKKAGTLGQNRSRPRKERNRAAERSRARQKAGRPKAQLRKTFKF